MFNVTDDIFYIGVDDTNLDLFEGLYSVPNGVSYNSYICKDEKIAVFDTVDNRKTKEWLKNLETCLAGAEPDYLIISHVEPDHSASIPAFLNKYPNATVVGNEKTFILINRFYGEIVSNKLIVKENDELSLGKHNLTFVFAPMVHWPEVMMVYDKTSNVLYSADAFGKFGTLSHQEDWLEEARNYYFNIVGKYGNMVQLLLKKASTLKISIICPLHGSVLSENINYYIDKYNTWSLYKPEEDGVFIAYASVYGNTANAAKKLSEELVARGIKTEIADLNRCDVAIATANAFKYSKLVIASTTYDAGIIPPVEIFINRLKSKNFCNRTVGLIQNGSWAPLSAKLMKVSLETCKNITFTETVVTVNSTLNEKSNAEIIKLADELSK